MHPFLKNFRSGNWFLAVRGYSLSISFTSWAVVFLYSLLQKGNILYGLTALLGILILHMAVNIFDDAVDYAAAERAIKKGIKRDFNFQKSKCALIFNKIFTLKQYWLASFCLFFTAFLFALFFISIYGSELLKILIPAAVLCLLYPILGCLGFGEFIVALVFSPLLYLGVNYVMTGNYSVQILLISVSTGLLSVAVLHNHMLLDFNYDETNRKITLCRICKTQKNALYLLEAIIALAYINIIFLTALQILSVYYLLVFLSLPSAITLCRVMRVHTENPKQKIKYNIFMGNVSEVNQVPENQRDFLLKFIIMRNLLNLFTVLICFAMVLSCIL